MSQTSDENEEGVFSQNQSGLSLSDDENNNEKLGWGVNLKKGPWASAEDAILMDYVKQHGEGSWNSVQKHSGLFRCGKSCRLRWANHLRPNLKKGAFSAEEERLIIDLHAKMGNKWARMAAYLPGRTDNEIKNYWNTRIKRRQRAGLPLYPPELCWEAFHENQSQNIDGINCGDKRPHSLLQSNGYEIPDIFFNGIKDNQVIIPYLPDLPEIHSSSLTKDFGSSSQYWRFMPPAMDSQKGFRESMQFDQGQDDTSIKNECYFGSSFPYDHDSITKYHLPFGANQGSHSLINNGNFSASKPRSGAVKSELPSLQYPETDFSSWGTSSFVPQPLPESVDDFIQSPLPTGTVKPERDSLHNSGLLDALLYEAKTLGNAKNHSSDKYSDTSTVVTPCDVPESSTLNIFETEWEDYCDLIAPFDHSASETSIFRECTPISGGVSSLDECTHIEAFLGHSVKSEPFDHVSPDNERETSTHFSRPDAFLGSYWLKQSSECDNEQTVKTDAISQLLGSDCGADYKRLGFGTSRGLDSFGWNNMRSACQMSDLP